MTVLAAGIALWGAQHTDGGRMAEAPRLSRFTSYPGVETMPAVPPDGKEIAYVRAEHDPIVGERFCGLNRHQINGIKAFTSLL